MTDLGFPWEHTEFTPQKLDCGIDGLHIGLEDRVPVFVLDDFTPMELDLVSGFIDITDEHPEHIFSCIGDVIQLLPHALLLEPPDPLTDHGLPLELEGLGDGVLRGTPHGEVCGVWLQSPEGNILCEVFPVGSGERLSGIEAFG